MKQYPQYKDSGVEWIGAVPESWEIKKLKYFVSKIGSGVTPRGGADVYQLSGVPLLRSQNIHFDGLHLDDVAYVSEEIHDNMSGSKVMEGDVLLNITGASIGRCCVVDSGLGEANVNQHVCIIRSAGELDGSFLSYYLQSISGQTQIELGQTGGGREGLNFEVLSRFLIPFLEDNEQTAIANYLDRKTAELDRLIANKERLIALYEEEKTAVINQAVTKGLDPDAPMKPSGIDWLGDIPEHWETRKLRYLFEIKKRIVGERGYDVLSITQRGIKIKDVESMDGQISSDYSKYQLVEKSDFAMNHMDLLTGYVDISNFEGVTSPDYRVFFLSDKENVDRYFLFLFQMGYKNKIFYAFGRGAAQFGRWRFPADEFKAFEFPVPPKDEQTAIVQHIETKCSRLDAIIVKFKKQIDLLKEYRTTLISEVVTGKIDVRDEVVQ